MAHSLILLIFLDIFWEILLCIDAFKIKFVGLQKNIVTLILLDNTLRPSGYLFEMLQIKRMILRGSQFDASIGIDD